MRKNYILSLALIALLSIFPQSVARADVAPPESPPGANLVPGGESTQVRMMTETVTLTVSTDPADENGAVAQTKAVFTMRNLGVQEEKMRARFPLSFFDGASDGFGNFPEIESIAVKINGVPAPVKRQMQPFFNTELPYREREEIPWAVFDMVFPPTQDVTIEVDYTVNGFGYYPYEVFKYILETGAGWNGTIGVADVILRLPYPASKQNVWLEDAFGYGDVTSGGVISGSEVRWHFEELEPTREDNIMVMIVTPSLWTSVLRETDAVTKNPDDGEAWGRLGKAYKEILRQKHGELRTDSAGREMFALSRNAYEKCVALLPNDSLWHYGYADLLWAHYYFDQVNAREVFPRILSELDAALKLDPNNLQARELLTEISYFVPGAVEIGGENYVLLGLTATPVMPTPDKVEVMATPTFAPTETPYPLITQTVTPPMQPPTAKNPICGAAFILPVFVVGIWTFHRKRV